jgi:cytochrome c6
MKKMLLALGVIATISVIASSATAENAGEKKFKEQCAVCHPDGGNIINPNKTLHKKDREANKVKTAADIVKLMRNPGPGMNKFDEKTISDKDAKAIAAYILKTF